MWKPLNGKFHVEEIRRKKDGTIEAVEMTILGGNFIKLKNSDGHEIGFFLSNLRVCEEIAEEENND